MAIEKGNLQAALDEYLARQARTRHPRGRFETGNKWYPDEDEEQPCCGLIRKPSRRFSYSLLVHCRTAEHVARLFDVDVHALKRLARNEKPPKREGGDNYYKAVAVVDGRFFSIYDGKTEYVLGQTLEQTARQEHGGGFYVYDDPNKALDAAVPENSVLKSAMRAILRLKCEGSYCRYDNGKLAFSRVTPMEVISLHPVRKLRYRGYCRGTDDGHYCRHDSEWTVEFELAWGAEKPSIIDIKLPAGWRDYETCEKCAQENDELEREWYNEQLERERQADALLDTVD